MFSLGHRPKNSNCHLTSAESAFQLRIGQNSWQAPATPAQAARGRARTPKAARNEEKRLHVSRGVLLECDASSHRFPCLNVAVILRISAVLASSFIFGTWGLTLTWDLALGIWNLLPQAASMTENNPSGSSDRDS